MHGISDPKRPTPVRNEKACSRHAPRARPDRNHPSQTDGSATNVREPSTRPAALRNAPPLPSHIPSTSERTGMREEAGARSSTCIRGETRARLGLRSASGQSLVDTFGAAFCVITSKARRISCCSPAKSAVSSDFFGLITTSTNGGTSGQQLRTDSRKRRFIRFRSTAPPRARLTVKPMRIPAELFSVAETRTIGLPASCFARGR
jgi:hypothetical protein